MAKKLFIKTMGCQMNEYDSDKMADVLRESHGYELTDSPDNLTGESVRSVVASNSCRIVRSLPSATPKAAPLEPTLTTRVPIPVSLTLNP